MAPTINLFHDSGVERDTAVAYLNELGEIRTERQLLYVACTRARDWLFVSGIEPGSEYLEEMVRLA